MRNLTSLSKSELVKLAQSLESKLFDLQGGIAEEDQSAERLSHDLKVHQEELEMQNQELRLISEALEQSRNRYATLYDFAPVSYCSLDERGLIYEANLTCCKLLKTDRKILQGKPLTAYLKEGYRHPLYNHLRETFKSTSRQTVDVALQSRVGETIHVQLDSVAIYDADHNRKLAWTSITDITARKMVEKRLKESEANLNAIFENTKDVIWLIDNRYRFIAFNTSFNKIRRLTVEANIAHTLLHSSNVNFYWKNLYDRALQGEHFTEKIEYTIDGSLMIFEFSFNPIFSEGIVYAVSVFGKDVTERERLLEELRTAKEKAETLSINKSRFFAHVNHELRTPLNAILGYISVMQDSAEDTSDHLSIIEKNVKKMVNSINDILQLSKLDWSGIELHKVAVPLCATVTKQVELFTELAKKRQLALDLKIHQSDLVMVFADPKYLEQIINNLLSNAIKFTDKGTIAVDVMESDGQPILSVQDSGRGISKEFLPHLFSEFKQASTNYTNVEGSGLGLSITKRLIELMGGRITVKSEVDVGTCFTVYLPKAVNAARSNVS